VARKKFGTVDFEGVGAEATGFYDGPPPRAGSYVGKVKRILDTVIKSGDHKGEPRLEVIVEITGPKTAKNIEGESAIGAGVFTGLNLTEQGAGYVNQFLHALAKAKTPAAKTKIEKEFWGKGKYDGIVTDDDDLVTKIGKSLVIEGNEIGFTTKLRTYEGEKRADISRFMIADSSKVGKDVDDDEDDEDDEDIESEEDDDDEEEDDEDDVEDDDEEDGDERQAELEGLNITALRKEAKALDIDTKGLDKEDLVEAILEAEAESDDEEDDVDDDDEDEDDDDERRDELADLSLADLKKVAKKVGLKLADYKGKSAEEIIDLIVDAESEEEDEDEEDDVDDEDGEALNERKAELDDMALPDLRKEAKKVGIEAADYRGLKKPELIALIIENDPPF
jgi:hypothetical protein